MEKNIVDVLGCCVYYVVNSAGSEKSCSSVVLGFFFNPSDGHGAEDEKICSLSEKEQGKLWQSKKRGSYVMDQPPCLEYDNVDHFRYTSAFIQNRILGDVCRVIL